MSRSLNKIHWADVEISVIVAILPDGKIAACDVDRAAEDPVVSREDAIRFEVTMRFPAKEITKVELK